MYIELLSRVGTKKCIRYIHLKRYSHVRYSEFPLYCMTCAFEKQALNKSCSLVHFSRPFRPATNNYLMPRGGLKRVLTPQD